MDNNRPTVDVIENDLILSGIGAEQIRIPLSEVHNALEILKGSIRIHSSTAGWIEKEWNADKAAELSVKLVKAWFAVPRIQTCQRNESFSTPVQKVEMSADGFALLEGDKRTVVTPENLARMSLRWTIFGRNPRWVNIPGGPMLILPKDKQTMFWFHRYIEAWKHMSIKFRAAVLSQSSVSVFDSPAADAKIKMTYKKGDKFTITGPATQEGTQWVEVRSDSGEIGFIPAATKIEETQPQNPLVEALNAGALAGAGAGLAAHYFAGGKLTFPIWIAAYVLVIANVKNKFVATVVFVAVASLVSVVLGSLAPSK